MENSLWIIIIIIWTVGMLVAAFFGMKEDLKNKKNDSPDNLKAVKRFLIMGLVSVALGIIMLFCKKFLQKLSIVGGAFITEGILLIINGWSQQYKGKKNNDE